MEITANNKHCVTSMGKPWRLQLIIGIVLLVWENYGNCS